MSKNFKFTVSRTAVIDEVYIIEADSWEEAEMMLHDEQYSQPIYTEWVDWHGNWHKLKKEYLCPLTKMIKEFQ
jgi:hypothetical protein